MRGVSLKTNPASLKHFLPNESDKSQRKRYRELLRDDTAQTLTEASDLDEEMRSLLGAFS
jgi:hypothetical protein